MSCQAEPSKSGRSIRKIARLAGVAIFLALTIAATTPARAQTYSVLYNFSGGMDGASPRAGVTLDQAGNLYGTTTSGGNTVGNCSAEGLHGCGNIFKLKHVSAGWVLTPLYLFQWTDGASPYARVVFGPDGSLYGTTTFGGHPADDCFLRGCGLAFNLRPPATVCKTVFCFWTETVLNVFRYDLAAGGCPYYGDLVFDRAGNIYGTTYLGRTLYFGDVFQLAPSNGSWTTNFLYSFPGTGERGEGPYSGVILDGAGNVYGTVSGGAAYNYGAVYELVPSGSNWTEQLLYSFQNGDDGGFPLGGVIFDQSGNLFGTTEAGGARGGGTVFELSPSNGGWSLTTLYSFSGTSGSFASLALDAAGNLYGTTYGDGANGQGNVFKLTRSSGGWSYSSLHDFTGGSDGGHPYGQVSLDAAGNLYGTASTGGANNQGVVWEINP